MCKLLSPRAGVLACVSLVVLSCTSEPSRSIGPITADGELSHPEPYSQISRLNPGQWPPQLQIEAGSFSEFGWQNVNVRSQMWWGSVNQCTDDVPQRRFGQQSDGSYAIGPPTQRVFAYPPAAEVTGNRVKVYVSTLHDYFAGTPYNSYAEEYTTDASDCIDAPPGTPPPPALTASISGPNVISSEGYCTWYGSASGGVQPYTYAWTRNGELVSTGSSYTAETQGGWFSLQLTVTDAPGTTVIRSLSVSEDPAAGTCPF